MDFLKKRIPGLNALGLGLLIGFIVLFFRDSLIAKLADFINPNTQNSIQNSSQNTNPIKATKGNFRVIKGAFVIIGKQPDGDSLRFIADQVQYVRQLKNASRVKISADGSVQLRFEAIDAPELHFSGVSQPLGAESRDALLHLMGFKDVTYTASGLQVVASTPARLRGAILSAAAEGNGRPVSYVLLDRDARDLKDGSRIDINADILQRTLNNQMLQNGMAYLTVYNTTPESQRLFLKNVAARARKAQKGIWKFDKTHNFALVDQDSIGAKGQLILPKLFRRASSYLQDRQNKKFKGSFIAWIQTHQSGQSQNDVVRLKGDFKHLSDFISQQANQVQFKADMLELVFGE